MEDKIRLKIMKRKIRKHRNSILKLESEMREIHKKKQEIKTSKRYKEELQDVAIKNFELFLKEF